MQPPDSAFRTRKRGREDEPDETHNPPTNPKADIDPEDRKLKRAKTDISTPMLFEGLRAKRNPMSFGGIKNKNQTALSDEDKATVFVNRWAGRARKPDWLEEKHQKEWGFPLRPTPSPPTPPQRLATYKDADSQPFFPNLVRRMDARIPSLRRTQASDTQSQYQYIDTSAADARRRRVQEISETLARDRARRQDNSESLARDRVLQQDSSSNSPIQDETLEYEGEEQEIDLGDANSQEVVGQQKSDSQLSPKYTTGFPYYRTILNAPASGNAQREPPRRDVRSVGQGDRDSRVAANVPNVWDTKQWHTPIRLGPTATKREGLLGALELVEVEREFYCAQQEHDLTFNFSFRASGRNTFPHKQEDCVSDDVDVKFRDSGYGSKQHTPKKEGTHAEAFLDTPLGASLSDSSTSRQTAPTLPTPITESEHPMPSMTHACKREDEPVNRTRIAAQPLTKDVQEHAPSMKRKSPASSLSNSTEPLLKRRKHEIYKRAGINEKRAKQNPWKAIKLRPAKKRRASASSMSDTMQPPLKRMKEDSSSMAEEEDESNIDRSLSDGDSTPTTKDGEPIDRSDGNRHNNLADTKGTLTQTYQELQSRMIPSVLESSLVSASSSPVTLPQPFILPAPTSMQTSQVTKTPLELQAPWSPLTINGQELTSRYQALRMLKELWNQMMDRRISSGKPLWQSHVLGDPFAASQKIFAALRHLREEETATICWHYGSFLRMRQLVENMTITAITEELLENILCCQSVLWPAFDPDGKISKKIQATSGGDWINSAINQEPAPSMSAYEKEVAKHNEEVRRSSQRLYMTTKIHGRKRKRIGDWASPTCKRRKLEDDDDGEQPKSTDVHSPVLNTTSGIPKISDTTYSNDDGGKPGDDDKDSALASLVHIEEIVQTETEPTQNITARPQEDWVQVRHLPDKDTQQVVTSGTESATEASTSGSDRFAGKHNSVETGSAEENIQDDANESDDDEDGLNIVIERPLEDLSKEFRQAKLARDALTPCNKVNNPQGCPHGANCRFSHSHDGYHCPPDSKNQVCLNKSCDLVHTLLPYNRRKSTLEMCRYAGSCRTPWCRYDHFVLSEALKMPFKEVAEHYPRTAPWPLHEDTDTFRSLLESRNPPHEQNHPLASSPSTRSVVWHTSPLDPQKPEMPVKSNLSSKKRSLDDSLESNETEVPASKRIQTRPPMGNKRTRNNSEQEGPDTKRHKTQPPAYPPVARPSTQGAPKLSSNNLQLPTDPLQSQSHVVGAIRDSLPRGVPTGPRSSEPQRRSNQSQVPTGPRNQVPTQPGQRASRGASTTTHRPSLSRPRTDGQAQRTSGGAGAVPQRQQKSTGDNMVGQARKHGRQDDGYQDTAVDSREQQRRVRMRRESKTPFASTSSGDLDDFNIRGMAAQQGVAAQGDRHSGRGNQNVTSTAARPRATPQRAGPRGRGGHQTPPDNAQCEEPKDISNQFVSLMRGGGLSGRGRSRGGRDDRQQRQRGHRSRRS